MKRRFAFPIAVAVAFHAIVLFGFRPGRIETLREERTHAMVLKPVPTDIAQLEPKEPETEPAPMPKGSPESPPVSPDDLVRPPRPDEPTISVEPTRPVAETKNLTKIPTTFGVPEGIGTFGTNSNSIFKSSDLDGTPRTRAQMAPAYPFEAKKSGLAGEVVVEFIVDETGAVRAPRVVRSSDRMFEEPTLRAVSKWRFEPGRREGKIVSFRMMVPVMFNLSE